ncbi:proteasome assembly chaperone 1 [Anticarsia gemmatalis]|uniref:proteasome assembly chaperone 1 n=1 Tax=Anticarsia gemmatalis TaxID=129554 RepID=UPI003F75D560
MSGFGEISEPSTRTAWEDWDDVLQKEAYPELRLQKTMEPPTEIDTFIILEGRYLYDRVKNQHELVHVNSIPEVNLHLYKSKLENNYICIIKDYNLVQSSEIVELLKEYIVTSSDVIAVLTKPLVEYQVAQFVNEEYVIRSLNTSTQTSRNINCKYPSLEQPNIIAGVAAGALSLREIVDKPAVILVCYIEHPEEQKIYELQDLLDKLHVIPKVDQANRSSILNSNLYI